MSHLYSSNSDGVYVPPARLPHRGARYLVDEFKCMGSSCALAALVSHDLREWPTTPPPLTLPKGWTVRSGKLYCDSTWHPWNNVTVMGQ